MAAELVCRLLADALVGARAARESAGKAAQKAKERAGELASKAKERTGNLASKVKDRAGKMLETVKERGWLQERHGKKGKEEGGHEGEQQQYGEGEHHGDQQ